MVSPPFHLAVVGEKIPCLLISSYSVRLSPTLRCNINLLQFSYNPLTIGIYNPKYGANSRNMHVYPSKLIAWAWRKSSPNLTRDGSKKERKLFAGPTTVSSFSRERINEYRFMDRSRVADGAFWVCRFLAWLSN